MAWRACGSESMAWTWAPMAGFAEIICATVTLLSVAVIVLNVYTEVAGATVKSDGSPSNHSGGSHSRLASEADVFSSRSEY